MNIVTVSAVAAVAVMAGMCLLLTRALLGPTAYDRVLALNNFGTKTVVLIAVLGFLTERPEFLDLALAYALINFIGTIAVLKYIEYGNLGAATRSDAATLADGGAATTPEAGAASSQASAKREGAPE